MNYLTLALRLIHIIAGVFWVGGALTAHFFVSPTLSALGAQGQPFAQHFMSKSRFSQRISAAAGLTILAGAGLYWLDSDGLTSAWMKSGAGVGFTLGAVFALIGFVFGILNGVNFRALASATAQVQGQPTKEQQAQIQSIQKRLAVSSPLTAYPLIVAVVFMAVARYMTF